jgi:acetyl-CoA synthetase
MFPYQIKTLQQYHDVYRYSVESPKDFWGEIASHFRWHKPWDEVLDWNFQQPMVNWFSGGKLNITENCLDRWAETQPDAPAIIWESNDPKEAYRILSYKELLFQVSQFAQVLHNNGVRKGDRICLYMPMVPELAIAVLACARMGAIHSVIFGGFSAQSIADRIHDAGCRLVITADGAYRGNKEILLKATIDDALVQCPSVQKVIVLTRTRCPLSMIKDRDVWWEDEIQKVESAGNPFFEAVSMNAEDPLFILYTSGSTGKPKGVVHSTAGYMVYTHYTFINVFQYQPGDVFFCTADIGWITGHSYLVYAPLSAGATTLMFEGIPTWPDAGRLWDIVDKFSVNILYTAPTAIRSLMSFGSQFLEGKNLSSLKVLGSVGEPINEEAWHWFDTQVGKGRCPIVDTWWQTETGGILISNLAGITPEKPSFATLPMPGVQVLLADEHGNEVKGTNSANKLLPHQTVQGNLCIQFPWPSILRTTYGDHERCRTTYFATYPNLYFTGDGCLRDEEGHYRITGRVDDVLNVSGHRIGTAEVENAINRHAGVVESAVVGVPHDIKGQGIYAYVIYQGNLEDEKLVKADILVTVTRLIGALAKPDYIQFVSGLPKTRSGKIMRRFLRKIAEGDMNHLGDTSTLLDPAVLDEIIAGRQKA